MSMNLLLLFICAFLSFSSLSLERNPSSLTDGNSDCLKALEKLLKEEGVDELRPLKGRSLFSRASRDFLMAYEKTEFTSVSKYDVDVKSLVDPMEGLVARVALIRNAKRSIDMTTYVFGNDEVGRVILNELIAAVERGVSVRLIYDSIGTIGPGKHPPHGNAFKALQKAVPGKRIDLSGKLTSERATVEVASFNSLLMADLYLQRWTRKILRLVSKKHRDLPINNYRLNHRLHDKILIVDVESKESYGIFGGRNIANEYFDQSDPHKNFKDFEVMLKINNKNDSSRGFNELITEYIDRLYFHVGNRYLYDFFEKLSEKKQEKELRKMREAHKGLNFDLDSTVSKFVESDGITKGYTRSSVKFIHELNNLAGPSFREKRFYQSSIVRTFHKDIRSAKRKVTLLSPYVNLKKQDLYHIKQWLSESPDHVFEIITPSVFSNNHAIVQAYLDFVVLRRIRKSLKTYVDKGQVNIRSYYEEKKSSDLVLTRRSLFQGTFRTVKHRIYHPQLHAKIISIDDNTNYVMSFNYNGRSRYYDTESGLRIIKAEKNHKTDEVQDYISHIRKKSVEYRSKEWMALYQRPEMKGRMHLYRFLAFFISAFKLEKHL